MGLLDWLFGRAPDIDTPAPPVQPPASRRYIPPPGPEPDIEEDVSEDQITDVIDLDEIYVAMDYTDAKGKETRRRITMLRLVRGPVSPILRAICHERRALRSFRIDRISCFITGDGEVIEPDRFFREILRIDPSSLGPDQVELTARKLRERIRAPVSILLVAGWSDGELHPEELDVIQRYAERHILHLIDSGEYDESTEGEVRMAELDRLNKMIAMMRPQRRSLPRYIRRVTEFDAEQFDIFRRTIEEVIMADGKLHPDELAFLDELSQIRHPESGAHLTIPEWTEWEG